MSLSCEPQMDNKFWGYHTALDLFGCNGKIIRSREKIQSYVIELCKLIDVKRFGDCQIVNFGEDELVTGYSMVQLIETSLISGHFVNHSNAACIDVFSCKAYDIEEVIRFTCVFFDSEHCNVFEIHRLEK